MKIFIDVDNTIVEHYGFYSTNTESRVHSTFSRYPQQNIIAISDMYKSSICHDPDIIRDLFFSDDVYILTKYNTVEYEVEKKKRLSTIFGITVEELENMTDKNGHKKYIAVEQNDSKVHAVKRELELYSINDCILIDDYSENLIEWESYGGLGIKYYNEYNSTTHPTNGLTISNFKIFRYYLEEMKLCNLLVIGKNRYKLKEVISRFDDIFDFVSHDFLKIVFEDLTSKLEIESLTEHIKYSHYNFIIEYYKFINNTYREYWNDKIIEELQEGEFNLISSSFEIEVPTFKTNNSLTFKINGSNDDDIEHVYDVYLTLNEERFIDDIEKIYNSLLLVFKNIIKT